MSKKPAKKDLQSITTLAADIDEKPEEEIKNDEDILEAAKEENLSDDVMEALGLDEEDDEENSGKKKRGKKSKEKIAEETPKVLTPDVDYIASDELAQMDGLSDI